MIVVLKEGVSQEKVSRIVEWLETFNVNVQVWNGINTTVIGLIGDTAAIDQGLISSHEDVDNIKRIQEPYKSANRKLHPGDTVVEIGDWKIGGGHFQVIAGPCSVEGKEQILEVATKVKQSGANLLRGGAFKPRTSPYAFQGMGADGIDLLLEAKKETGMPIVSEIMNIAHLPLFEHVDVIQVGARNMQNFELLKALGKIDKPILLKRGMANTIEELIMSAEYIMAEGNKNVILCERGIRTFETATRNTLDISAIPILKKLTHLPVIIDPSHAAGLTWLVEPLSKAAIAAGADGLIIEVHNDPAKALCDGKQSLTPDQFDGIMNTLKKYVAMEDKQF